ncbi:trihelix transcription factor ASIL2-like [Lolium rigidum]|uniref:trihelix transcription factor ASIL2-like n=1 Tax=Lolium rigidum TaxID=89674 RepID=UPI001F5E1BB5|nr:trihelix transcription factor ASIL2-like [Lolium rigidum]
MSSPATRRRRPPPPPPAWTPEPWSDGETSALLEAWGPRHLRAGGGPLLTADWRACAAAVAARRAAGGRAPRTVDQCKNRMDYLKKRLKALRLGPSPPPPLSGYLRRLRKLLRQAPSVPFGVSHRRHAPFGRRRTAVALSPVSPSVGHSHGNAAAGCTEVAAALDRLAGTYERVEAAKQREAARLEERRLEAIRDLEIERLRVLVDVAVPAPADAETPSAAPAPAAASPAAA